jgi:hypothetical protein
MDKITASKTIEAWWIDTLTGNKSKVGSFQTSEITPFIRQKVAMM